MSKIKISDIRIEDEILEAEQRSAFKAVQARNETTQVAFSLNQQMDNEDAEVADLVAEWHFNSRVLDGRSFRSLKKLAEYISEKLGVPVTRDDIERHRKAAVTLVRRSLSDTDKAELVKEQMTMLLSEAHNDRSKAVALHDQLESTLDHMINELNFEYHDKAVKSILFFLQSQQNILFQANDRVLNILKELVSFGRTRETDDNIRKILNEGTAGTRPLTAEETIAKIYEIHGDPLPSAKHRKLELKGEQNERLEDKTCSNTPGVEKEQQPEAECVLLPPQPAGRDQEECELPISGLRGRRT